MSSSTVCLFHNRRYSSNIQHILNLLRINTIKSKCDLNYIAKKSLCVCNLSDNQLAITDEQLNKIQKLYVKIKTQRCLDEIDQLLEKKIMTTCDNKISIYKLLKLICDISTEKTFLKMIQRNNQLKSVRHQRHANSISRQIELTVPPNQIGHLLGRNGHLHKAIMEDTKTQIHFNNVPYSIESKNQCSDFNLDLFQSSYALTATITGDTMDAVDNATKALQDLDQETQV